MIHKLGHDVFLLLKHERKSGPEEPSWLHRRTTAYLEDIVKIAKKGEQGRVARGDLPQALFDGVLPKRDSHSSVHGGRPSNLAHGREHQRFPGTCRPRGSISGGSGPSSSGCLRRAAESRLRRRHIRNGHLAIARHLLEVLGKASGMRSSVGRRRRCGILGRGGSLFIGPFRSVGPATL